MLLFTDFGVNSALVKFATRPTPERPSKSVEGLIKARIYFELITALLMVLTSVFLAEILGAYFANMPGTAHLTRTAFLSVDF
mgnify:CR=1 FL=1